MNRHLSAVTFFVDDYDTAIRYFTTILGYAITEDKVTGEDSRFVLVTPPNSDMSLLLSKAKTSEERALIGKQAANKVFLILYTDDFYRDYEHMQANAVEFLEAPREESYGIVAIFKDCYGNKWDLIQTA